MSQTLVQQDIFTASKQFHPSSRLWIYQSDREFSLTEINEIQEKVTDYTSQWIVHGSPAKAVGELAFGRFLLLTVDQSTPASGCSIDASVEFVKQLGATYNVDFFNRLQICYLDSDDNKIKSLHLSAIKKAVEDGELSDEVIVFDQTITKLHQLDGEWMIPFKDSWLAS